MSSVHVFVFLCPGHQLRFGTAGERMMKSSADVAQLVEHSLGKGEVIGSIPIISSRFRGFAQVAEWLKATDCKSVAPWSYGGSNPPLCTRLRNNVGPFIARTDWL